MQSNNILKERKGFGNWQEILEVMGSDKTKEELENHFNELYISNIYKNVCQSNNKFPIKAPILTTKDENGSFKIPKRI